VIFRHPKALRQLITSGIVATMRSFRYKKGQSVVIKTESGKLKGRIIEVVPNTPENRIKYYKLSGFETPEEWLAEAVKMHKKTPKYIVVVELGGTGGLHAPEKGDS